MHKDHSNDIGKSSQITLNHYNIDEIMYKFIHKKSMYKFIVYVLSVIFVYFQARKA